MSGFPRMDEYLSIKSRIANTCGEPAMVLVRMCNDDSADIAELKAVLGQPSSKCGLGLRRVRADVDQGNGILSDEVNINVADIERRRNGKWNDLHFGRLLI